MSGRPEEDSSSYPADGYDPDAWEEFTPWRPGDPSTAGEAPVRYAAGEPAAGTRGGMAQGSEGQRGSRQGGAAEERQDRSGRWWTEDVGRKYAHGDRVRNRGAAGGAVASHVPAGTRGEVVSTRKGLMGGTFATVEFENGYTEEVRTENLERRGWLD